MMLEWLTWIRTPASRPVRELGCLHELVGIAYRSTRLHDAWKPHLEVAQAVVTEAALACPGRGRAVVLGSGVLLDLPLEVLLERFDELILVDLAHLPEVRKRVKSHPKIRLEERDLTGFLTTLHAAIKGGISRLDGLPLPPPAPILGSGPTDLLVSLNLLSQLTLPLVEQAGTQRRLNGAPVFSPPVLQARARLLMLEHLRGLLDAQATQVCLVTDTWRQAFRPDGGLEYEESMLEDLSPPIEGRRWRWSVAPRPELDPDLDFFHDMIGVSDLRAFETPLRVWLNTLTRAAQQVVLAKPPH